MEILFLKVEYAGLDPERNIHVIFSREKEPEVIAKYLQEYIGRDVALTIYLMKRTVRLE